MTTATLTLFRVQTRLLAWPLLVLSIGVVVLLLPDVDIVDLFVVTGGVFVAIAAVFSGPLLFGSEYAHGADGYLATRPVSPRLVFFLKVLLLLLYSAVAAVVVDFSLPTIHNFWPMGHNERTLNIFQMHLIPVVWGVLFSLTLWCTAVTVFARDTIRGVLYGVPSFAVVPVLAWLIPWPFFKTSITDLHEEIIKQTALYVPIQDEIYMAGAIALSPVLFLALLAIAYRSQSRCKFSVPPLAPVLCAIFFSYIAMCSISLHNDGNASFYCEGIKGVDTEKGLVYFWDRGSESVVSAPAEDPSGKSSPIFRTDNPWMIDCIYPIQERLLVIQHRYRDTLPSVAILQDQAGTIAEGSMTVHLDSEFYQARILDSDRIALLTKGYANYGRRKDPDWHILNLQSGAIESKRTIEGYSPFTLLHLNRRYSYNFSFFTVGQPGWDRIKSDRDLLPKILIAEGETKPASGELPCLGSVVVDRNLLAGFPPIPDPPELREQHRDARYSMKKIALYNTTDLSSPKVTWIDVPDRVLETPYWTWKTLKFFGFRRKWQNFDEPCPPEGSSLTLGSGILALWAWPSSRAVMWDVSSPDNPRLLGVVPTPQRGGFIPDDLDQHLQRSAIRGPTSPIRSADGKIGYVLDYGILWFEFPQLTKGDGA